MGTFAHLFSTSIATSTHGIQTSLIYKLLEQVHFALLGANAFISRWSLRVRLVPPLLPD